MRGELWDRVQLYQTQQLTVREETPPQRSQAMYKLTAEDLKTLQEDLKNFFPHSLQVYGYIVQLRIGQKADPFDVFVDRWPKFNYVLIKPEIHQKGDYFKDLCVFFKDDVYLRDMLAQTDAFDWKRFICLATELHHEKVLETVAASKGVPVVRIDVCHMLVHPEPSKLSPVDSSSLKISSLNESHLTLINSTWKFGNEHSIQMIRNMILNFPSFCVLDSDDQPVAWILTYASCAMGMLYTIPEHRGKGYAKALVAIMSRKLHSLGYPVYCFIEEENQVSYRLFAKLGFKEVPNYKATWFLFNDL